MRSTSDRGRKKGVLIEIMKTTSPAYETNNDSGREKQGER
jgi:hypothetical protein